MQKRDSLVMLASRAMYARWPVIATRWPLVIAIASPVGRALDLSRTTTTDHDRVRAPRSYASFALHTQFGGSLEIVSAGASILPAQR